MTARTLVLAAVVGCAPSGLASPREDAMPHAGESPAPSLLAALDDVGARLVAAEVRLAFYEGAAFVSRRAEVLR